MKLNKKPLQPFRAIYLRNHVAQLTVAREMAGISRAVEMRSANEVYPGLGRQRSGLIT